MPCLAELFRPPKHILLSEINCTNKFFQPCIFYWAGTGICARMKLQLVLGLLPENIPEIHTGREVFIYV